MSSVYIAGYICRNDNESDDTKLYFKKFGSFTESINRGGLHIPNDNVCQFCIFSDIIFHEVVNKVCRNSLCNILMLVSDIYSLNMEKILFYSKTRVNCLHQDLLKNQNKRFESCQKNFNYQRKLLYYVNLQFLSCLRRCLVDTGCQ